jgi:tetratricopeptide (TPR) repeat protein
MKANPPPDRRKFADAWDEVSYLYDKLLFWLYQRQDPRRARPYAERLAKLLPTVAPQHDAIFGEECWSLVFEATGDLANAIRHRENEIRLIRHLHAISQNAPHLRLATQGYGYGDLSDRLDLLAVLYHDSGNLEKAIRTLQESNQLCEKHGIPFDGKDILEEYLEESQSTAAPFAARASRARRARRPLPARHGLGGR